jgi:hypothetical protein
LTPVDVCRNGCHSVNGKTRRTEDLVFHHTQVEAFIDYAREES